MKMCSYEQDEAVVAYDVAAAAVLLVVGPKPKNIKNMNWYQVAQETGWPAGHPSAWLAV